MHRYFFLSALLAVGPSAHGFQPVAVPSHGSAATRKTASSSSSSSSSTSILLAAEKQPTSEAGHHHDHHHYPPEFHRAIECAKHQGLCTNADELLQLAKELESYDGCMLNWKVEMATTTTADDDDDCEKEILDRLDIADLLRTEAEMIQRRDTIEFSNSFKERVEQEEGGQEEREKEVPKELIDLYSNYYECVYSKTCCGP